MFPKFIPLLFALCTSCTLANPDTAQKKRQQPPRSALIENPFKKIIDIPLPEGYKRMNVIQGSFAEWLRTRDLKKDRTVYKYDGTPKHNQSAQFAVLDISVGNKDLQQCADAVMRLRAEYFYAFKDFDQLVFSDNDGTLYKFDPPYSRENFDKYLERVFGMCGSASLQKQMRSHIQMADITPGDVLIHGGFPGHAEIVIDVPVNNKGDKIYLLAQSYMPAQDIHVLVNPINESLSPWYKVTDETVIKTPEYDFTKYELKRW